MKEYKKQPCLIASLRNSLPSSKGVTQPGQVPRTWKINARRYFPPFLGLLRDRIHYWELCAYYSKQGFPDKSVGKESACTAGDPGSIPGSGRSPGGGKGYPLQYSGLENSMDYTVHGVTKSLSRLFIYTYIFLVDCLFLFLWPLHTAYQTLIS